MENEQPQINEIAAQQVTIVTREQNPTAARDEANMKVVAAIQPKLARQEAMLVTDDQVNFTTMLDTLMKCFDRQYDLTRRTNERLEALDSAQTICRDQ